MYYKNLLTWVAAYVVLLTGCGVNETSETTTLPTEQSSDSIYTVPVSTGSKDIEFKIVDANYNQYDGTFNPKEQQKLKSFIIWSFDQLDNNVILPSSKYTIDFFKDKALVFINVVFSNSSSNLPTVDKVYYEGDKIQIDVKRGLADNEGIQWWCCFIEISKSDIVDANRSTTVNVNVDGELPNIE